MSDKEDLELAAKAAGYSVICCAGDRGLWLHGFEDEWDPRSSNEDAFRLAVDAGIAVIQPESTLGTKGVVTTDVLYGECEIGDDPYEATRLAIFRAAVEMGGL